MNQRIRLQADGAGEQLRLQAEAVGHVTLQAAGESGGVPSFEMLAYGGGVMTPNLPRGRVVVDLAGLVIPEQTLPCYRDHDPQRIVGHTTSIEITADYRVTASGLVSGGGPDAAEVRESAGKGFPWKCSLGAPIGEVEYVRAGASVHVNGQTFQGPLTVVRQAVLEEITFCATAGDRGAKATVTASGRNGREAGTMFEQWLQAMGLDADTLTEDRLEQLRATFGRELRHGLQLQAGAAIAGNVLQRIDAAGDDGAELMERVAAAAGITADNLSELQVRDSVPATELQAMAGALGCQVQDLQAAGGAGGNGGGGQRRRPAGAGGNGGSVAEQMRLEAAAELQRQAEVRRIASGNPELELRAIREGWNAQTTELEVLRAGRPTVHTGGGRGRSDGGPNVAALEAALLLASGIAEQHVLAACGEQATNQADTPQLQGACLHMIMDQVIHAAGHTYHGSRRTNSYIRATLDAEKQLRATASGFSTISLSGILGNVANKAMLASYQAVAVVWPLICAVRNHNDFKVHTHYRLDSKGSFKKVGATGELKHISLDEGSYTNQLDTYGALVSLTRQMQINDDLGAFMELPKLLGRMSAVRLEEAVFVLLLSNPGSFFSTNNRNYFDGASSALDIDSLTTAEQKFQNQVDSNGKPVLTIPDRLLVPSTLKVTAAQLHDETKIQTGSTGKNLASNPHAAKYRPVSTPYLNNTAITDQDGNAITGQSDTGWYLLGDPAVRAAIAVAFLNGRRVPFIESDDAEFSRLGMDWRAYHDFGVGMEDTVAAVHSKGAA